MAKDDWLQKQADAEKMRRLHPKGTSALGWFGNLVTAVAWSIGLIVALTILAGVALFLLARYGSETYVLECPGNVTDTRTPAFYGTTLYLEVTQFRPLVSLWSDDFGNAQAEMPPNFYSYLRMGKAGTAVTLESGAVSRGTYRPISRTISLNLDRDMVFDGQCSRRKD